MVAKTVYRDPTVPTRPPNVAERHALIEHFRPIMLERAASFRYAASHLEWMIENTPDQDAAVDEWSVKLMAALQELSDNVSTYRNLRDIQGVA